LFAASRAEDADLWTERSGFSPDLLDALRLTGEVRSPQLADDH
jgi:hypothetical protein